MSPTEPAALFETVLGERRAGRRFRRLPFHGVAWLLALGVHLVLWYAASQTEPSLEIWSARMAALIHEDLSEQAPVEIETPSEPEIEPRPKPKPRVRRVAGPKPAPPAAAAQVISVEAKPTGPVDLTDNTFIVGNSKTYVGGITTSKGTGTKPIMDRPSLARSVQLSANEWRCEWPASAVNEEIYEQFVVLRVVVAADGKVENATVVTDPGYGFGDAAVACALRTRFSPALDADGKPIRATSPSIRVRFTR
jgi:protein TonB